MGIEEQIDRLIDLGEDIKSRLDLLVGLASDHFAGADKMVVEEPAEEPPKKWRILEPGEVVCSSDLVNAKSNPPSDPPNGFGWRPVDASVGTTVYKDEGCIFARPVVEEPAKEPEPAWEPKVGDWVRVTRPSDWNGWVAPLWQVDMNRFDGTVGKIENQFPYGFTIRGFYGKCGFLLRWHRDWLSPADPPAKEPAEPEYREPVLPADLGKWAEFSHDGINWMRYKLRGCHKESESSPTIWSEKNIGFRHCRIKKDA